MYQLLVYRPGDRTPSTRVVADRAAEVLELIPKLLAEHAGCERVDVMLGQTRLFTVDCHGNTQA